MQFTAPQKYRAETYAESRRIQLDFTRRPLGFGSDGVVFESSRQTAVKVFERSETFWQEKACYDRLKARGITFLAGFNIPELVDSDGELLIVEMTIVQPPFVLDFGKVSIDRPKDYPAEARQERWEHWTELYGDHWPQVRRVLSALRGLGIHYLDPKPSNIAPADWDPDV